MSESGSQPRGSDAGPTGSDARPAWQLRSARSDDVGAVRALLAEAGLPDLPAHPWLSNLVVAREDGQVVGAIALDVSARTGLLRFVVVREDRRGRGLGRELFKTLLSRAFELGLRDVYALGDGVTGFLEALSFRNVERDAVPPELRSSEGFRELASDDAALLRLEL